MLQQTQVSRVIERLPVFLGQFPTPVAMAEQPAAAVISAWTGLGYNRRALNLHRAAQQIASAHHGAVPTGLAELLALPGVGPYTARAVRVFAFEEPDAVVDTNIGRVLARHTGAALKPAAAQALADSLVPAGHSWLWNQAIMELGALVCTKKPTCEVCPVRTGCVWFGGGRPDPDPSVGSAAVSKKQSLFEGSDRQGRARLVRALRDDPLNWEAIPDAMGWPHDPDRAERVLAGLLDDGLVVRAGARYALPT